MIRKFFRRHFWQYYLCNFQWYRKWYGGRWEYHYIDICHACIWLPMHPDRVWPDYRQPCSLGEPIIEDWK